jgi:hypothetical protein
MPTIMTQVDGSPLGRVSEQSAFHFAPRRFQVHVSLTFPGGQSRDQAKAAGPEPWRRSGSICERC